MARPEEWIAWDQIQIDGRPTYAVKVWTPDGWVTVAEGTSVAPLKKILVSLQDAVGSLQRVVEGLAWRVADQSELLTRQAAKREGVRTVADALDDLRTCPVRVGDSYRHYKGGLYVVTSVDVRESDCRLVVGYRATHAPSWGWSRTLEDFLEYVTPEGGPPEPRYRKLACG